MPIKPSRLQAGDVIGVVAPSSPTVHLSTFIRLEQWAAKHDFRLKIFPHAREQWSYLAGADADRAADLTAAFADPQIAAVLALRGGVGGWRMVPHIDYDVVRANPKFFCGYSDITALHLALARAADLVTFYGPVAASFVGRGASAYTERHWLRAATTTSALGEVEKDPDDPFTWAIRGGLAEGPLRGGCLSLLVQSLGTPWEVDWRGALVFFEDVNEEPYRLDGYLTQLRLAGKFDGVAGVIVGEHVNCGPRPYQPSYPYGTFTSEEVFRQQLEPLGVPVLVGLPCGHGKHLATLPLGVHARLDAGSLTLTVLEEATSP